MTDWSDALGALLPGPVEEAVEAERTGRTRPRPALFQPGLQLDLGTDDPDRPAVLRARPVTPRTSGGWQVSGTSWAQVGYAQRGDLPRTRRQRRLLTELLALARTDHWFSQSSPWLDLTDIDSRRVWDLLCELRDAGLPFVASTRPAAPAVLHDPVSAVLDVRPHDGGGLEVVGGVHVRAGDDAPGPDGADGAGGVRVPSRAVLLAEGTALAWWVQEQHDGKPARVLHVAPVPPALVPHAGAVLGLRPVRVPAGDVERFVGEYLPRLPDAVTVRSAAGVPRVERSVTLHATVTPDVVPGEGSSLRVEWRWERVPAGYVDHRRQAHLVESVGDVLDLVRPGLVRPRDPQPPDAQLTGMTAVRFAAEALPALRRLPGVVVEVTGDLPEYRAATQPPRLVFDALTPAGRDWYDLSVHVRVDDRLVPFVKVFVALTKGNSHVLLDNGVHFPLRDGHFDELLALIDESRLLLEAPEGALRVGKAQTATWSELGRLGLLAGQAAEWSRRARAVVAAPTTTDHEVPRGITATLRPYQRTGFGWLATLYEHGLGGVLADDMGLGKTLQTLALVQHVREKGLSDQPFLVVAPTSVVSVWAAEAARFAPGLRVATVTATKRPRGGTSVAEEAAGADVVVTSYALFRLEHKQYRAVEWAGLVLDEAQNVKNHESVAYTCARRLDAPWVLAITGTPMENHLMELWAIVSVVAPGLLSTPETFTDFYRLPVERGRDGARLAHLRARIAPILLRRTKEQVAPELPAKTEQVLEVDLAPKHRAAYEAFLQRERRKVLGLVDDLPRNKFTIFRSLTLLRQAALDIGLVDPDREPLPATKLDVLADLVEDAVAEGHRVLVFSQFTRFLRSAQDRLTAAGHATCYLDGATRDRDAVVAAFRAGQAPVFLVSLKAGGTGLTLTEADYCVLLDPWWNPASEAQAVDRAHRIGQTRPVVVYRLVARGTIEEKVMELARAKAGLFAAAFDDEALASTELSADDVRRLVG